MKNLKNKLRNNKKGFTLVEIIVVLVILAILAAAAIPTMLGFVEDSKGKAEIANARAAYVAAQSIVTEEEVSGVATKTLVSKTSYTIANAGASKLDKMLGADLAGVVIRATHENGKVSKLEYLSKPAKYVVTIQPGVDAVVVKATALPTP